MVTLKDLAAELGLSQVSVSQALRGTGRISPQTRQRVIETAHRLRYRPHALAKSMREGRTGIIGLIYSPEGTSRALTTPQLIGIQEEIAANNYELMLGMVPKARLASPGQASALLRQWMADGLLINHHIGLPPQVDELVEGDHVPAVWMNSKQSRHCIYFDDFGGARNAVRHLYQLGHRDIAYLDVSHDRSRIGGTEHYSITDRHDGYVQGMKDHGLTPRVWMDEMPIPHERRMAAARALLEGANRPTAVIAYGDAETPMFAAASLGLSVPRDVSIVHFAGERIYMNDILMTVGFLPYQDLGAQGVRRLLARISPSEAGSSAQTPLALPVEIQPGGSTAAPSIA
jgi:DNA-binding LacI/PurR family transcriptional regulator